MYIRNKFGLRWKILKWKVKISTSLQSLRSVACYLKLNNKVCSSPTSKMLSDCKSKYTFQRAYWGLLLGLSFPILVWHCPRTFAWAHSLILCFPLIRLHQCPRNYGLIIIFSQLEGRYVLLTVRVSVLWVKFPRRMLDSLSPQQSRKNEILVHSPQDGQVIFCILLVVWRSPYNMETNFFWKTWNNRINCSLFSLTHVYRNDLVDLVLHD